MSSHLGIAIGRVSLCPKLLKECIFDSRVLCQAIGELRFAGSCCVSSKWGITMCRAVGEFQLVGYCFVPIAGFCVVSSY